jgi:hypothetical protein
MRRTLASLIPAAAEFFGDFLVLLAFGGEQHDPRAFDHTRRKRPPAAIPFQDFAAYRAQANNRGHAHWEHVSIGEVPPPK